MANAYPKIHNAAWPGLVGKGGAEPGAEPVISQDRMLELTANARANGQKFDGFDIFLSKPHQDLESTDDDLKALADKVGAKVYSGNNLEIINHPDVTAVVVSEASSSTM